MVYKLDSRMKDLIMPLSRELNLPPHKLIEKILLEHFEQEEAKRALNEEGTNN